MKGLRRAYVYVAVVFFNVVVLFVVVNLAVRFGEHVGRRDDPLIEHYGMARLLRAYPGWSEPDLRALLEERRELERFEYAPVTEVRVAARRGRYVNVSPVGFRYVANQGPWPPDPAALTVFLFGGSTAFGDGLADADTLPSRLQELLNAAGSTQRVWVYDFACPGHRSTEERLLFDQLVWWGAIPNVAIFVDGFNDSESGDEAVPPYLWGTKMSEILRGLVEEYEWSDADPMSGVVSAAARLPAVRMTRHWLGKESNEDGKGASGVDSARIVDRWHTNRRMLGASAAAFGIRTLFVWQPAPFYHYDLKYHLFAEDVLQGEKSRRYVHVDARQRFDGI